MNKKQRQSMKQVDGSEVAVEIVEGKKGVNDGAHYKAH